MKIFPFTFLLLLTFILSCQNTGENRQKYEAVQEDNQGADAEFLLKVVDGEIDEPGARTGYVNLQGDTIISMGKYVYCFTDTLKTYAIVLEKGGRCIAIDRKEKELYEVLWYDNGPDYVSDGLFRIKQDGKIGYANEAGEIVIKPQFECTNPFEDGRARVAYTCALKKDGEHTMMESDAWFYIDLKGNKINE